MQSIQQMVVEQLKMSIVGSGLAISLPEGEGVAAGVGAAKHAAMNKQIPNTVNKFICGGTTLILLIFPIAELVASEGWRSVLEVRPTRLIQ